MSDRSVRFGIGVGEMLRAGMTGYRANPIPLSIAGVATLGTYVAFRLPAAAQMRAGHLGVSIGLDLLGLVAASVVAGPWHRFALAAADGRPVEATGGWFHTVRAQTVASIWFWAAVLLGLRYLYGIPSLLAVVFYGLYGFVIADGLAGTGLRALQASARIGEGRRTGLFALAAVLILFNLAGALPLGYAVTPVTLILASVGVVVTTNITLVGGARVYRVLARGAS